MAIAILIIVSVIITRAGIFFAVSAIVSVATIPFPFAFPSPSPSLSPYPTIPFPPTIQIKLQHHCATSSPSLQSHHIASLPSLLPTFVRSGVSRSRVCQLSDRRQVGGGRWVVAGGWRVVGGGAKCHAHPAGNAHRLMPMPCTFICWITRTSWRPPPFLFALLFHLLFGGRAMVPLCAFIV